jgi:SRSO17 transposase
VGRTKGFKKQGNSFKFKGQTKEVFLYPLDRNFRKKIGCDSKSLPTLDHKYLLSVKKTLPSGGNKMILRDPEWTPETLPPFELDENDIDTLGEEFVQFHKLFEGAFRRVEQINLSQVYLQGLMSPLDRKSMEPIALNFLGAKRVRSLQHFVSSGVWDLDHLSKLHKEEAAATLADPLGVINVDSSEFPKKGKESVGVARQYCGHLGKVENCQSGVFPGYSSPKGYGLIDRRIYLPEIWFTKEYEERREKCKIPEDVVFKKKPQLAAEMIKDVHESGLFPADWITCDCAYGNNHEFLDNLPEGLNYLADVPCDTLVWLERPETITPPYSGRGRRPKRKKLKAGEAKPIKVKKIAKDSSLDWKSVVLDEGAKGPIVANVARLRVIESRNSLPGKERWLLIRHNPDSKETKYFLSNASASTSFDEMCRVCILRWPIEQCFREGKSEIGMDHYEHRSWNAWHRHMTFVFLAQLFILRFRHTLKKMPPNFAPGLPSTKSNFTNEKFRQIICNTNR